jgi:hypothetical protein
MPTYQLLDCEVNKMTISMERIKEIMKPEQYMRFKDFMTGQTVESGKDGKTQVFDGDFLRWVKKMSVID